MTDLSPDAVCLHGPLDASEWQDKTLEAFNIKVEQSTDQEFFEGPLPEPLRVNDALMNDDVVLRKEADDETYNFMVQLLNAMQGNDRYCAMGYGIALLQAAGYTAHHQPIYILPRIILEMAGYNKSADVDLAILSRDEPHVSLVVQLHSSALTHKIRWPSIIAAAIATFQQNNLQLINRNRPPLEQAVIPGTIISGTTPVFFKVPVSLELSEAVSEGKHPPNTTTVSVYAPEKSILLSGARVPQYRVLILKQLEAFKKFVRANSPP